MPPDQPPTNGTAVGRSAESRPWALLLVAVVLLVAGSWVLAPDKGLPANNLINALFGARWVMGGGRALVAACAVFLLASICARAWNRQWLTKAGPVEVEAVQDAVNDLIEDGETKDEALTRLRKTNDELVAQLGELLQRLHEAETANETRGRRPKRARRRG